MTDHSNERLGILQEKTLAAFFDPALSCSGTYVVQQPPLSVTADFALAQDVCSTSFFRFAMVSLEADCLPEDIRGSGESDANRTRGRGGREYVTNAALGLKRPLAAFQLFLAAQTGNSW